MPKWIQVISSAGMKHARHSDGREQWWHRRSHVLLVERCSPDPSAIARHMGRSHVVGAEKFSHEGEAGMEYHDRQPQREERYIKKGL